MPRSPLDLRQSCVRKDSTVHTPQLPKRRTDALPAPYPLCVREERNAVSRSSHNERDVVREIYVCTTEINSEANTRNTQNDSQRGGNILGAEGDEHNKTGPKALNKWARGKVLEWERVQVSRAFSFIYMCEYTQRQIHWCGDRMPGKFNGMLLYTSGQSRSWETLLHYCHLSGRLQRQDASTRSVHAQRIPFLCMNVCVAYNRRSRRSAAPS